MQPTPSSRRSSDRDENRGAGELGPSGDAVAQLESIGVLRARLVWSPKSEPSVAPGVARTDAKFFPGFYPVGAKIRFRLQIDGLIKPV
jgi:hypothetical protein